MPKLRGLMSMPVLKPTLMLLLLLCLEISVCAES